MFVLENKTETQIFRSSKCVRGFIVFWLFRRTFPRIPQDFFYFSGMSQALLRRCVSCMSTCEDVAGLYSPSRRQGRFSKETWQNFVVKWLRSSDFLHCHDAGWNALLNLCWLMCENVFWANTQRSECLTDAWPQSDGVFPCGSSALEGAREFAPTLVILL